MSLLSSGEKLEAYLRAKAHIEEYLASESHRQRAQRGKVGWPALTISRQAGARGITIGEKLVAYLQEHERETEVPWALLNRDLVKKVLEDHQLPSLMAKFMPEDTSHEIEHMVGEILGRHPSVWSLLEKTAQTILKLGRIGHVILVGRGSNIITGRLKNVIHVRFVGSPEKRAAHLCRVFDYSTKEAQAYMKREDDARQRYLKKNFGKDIEDPLNYDLVVNTDRLTDEMVVETIAHLIFQKDRR